MVGTGFSEKALEHLYDGLQKIKRPTCPFVNLQEKTQRRWRQGVTRAVIPAATSPRRVVWGRFFF
jgi:hypothetical protein